MVHFQEVPTGYEASNHDEIVGEELVDATQEVEQEAIAMSRPDREVRNQLKNLALNLDRILNLILYQEHIEMVPLSEVRPLEVKLGDYYIHSLALPC